MKADFDKILFSDKAKNFIKKCNQLFYDKNYPYITYIGINYYEDQLINVKLYCTSFKKVAFEYLHDIIPFADKIEKYYKEYQESRVCNIENMGAAFVLKLDKELNEKYTVFIRTKENLNPKQQRFDLVPESKIVDDYFAMEGNHENIYLKNYYAIHTKENVNRMLSYFDFKVNPKHVDIVEHSVFQDKYKILACMPSIDKVEDYLYQNESEKVLELHESIKSRFNFVPASPGAYLGSNVKCIHYLDKGENLYFRNSYVFQEIQNLYKQITS